MFTYRRQASSCKFELSRAGAVHYRQGCCNLHPRLLFLCRVCKPLHC